MARSDNNFASRPQSIIARRTSGGRYIYDRMKTSVCRCFVSKRVFLNLAFLKDRDLTYTLSKLFPSEAVKLSTALLLAALTLMPIATPGRRVVCFGRRTWGFPP